VVFSANRLYRRAVTGAPVVSYLRSHGLGTLLVDCIRLSVSFLPRTTRHISGSER